METLQNGYLEYQATCNNISQNIEAMPLFFPVVVIKTGKVDGNTY